MALLVPSEVTGGGHCGAHAATAETDDYSTGGCGSQDGRTAGNEIANFEKQLAQDETSREHETEIKLPLRQSHPPSQPVSKKAAKEQRAANGEYKPGVMPKQVKTQTMGKCERCGYMSSQKVCKACTLIEGLNKTRPKTDIQLDPEDEESSTTLARQMEAVGIVNS
ncbi:nucleotidyltransferase [Ascosphaera atra]|nr:nucleotidyltransferase [Ascosphaera atra]